MYKIRAPAHTRLMAVFLPSISIISGLLRRTVSFLFHEELDLVKDGSIEILGTNNAVSLSQLVVLFLTL